MSPPRQPDPAPRHRRATRQPSDQADPKQRQLNALQAATAARQADAAKRADAGLRQLIKDGAEINFRSVARAGSVSLNFLYDHPELRQRIEGLRTQQQSAHNSRPVPEPANTDSNIIRTLAAQLKTERTRHRDQLHELENRLAAAHQEILRLKRHTPDRDRPTPNP